MFLTDHEKENIKNWKYAVEDRSYISALFNPFWNWLCSLIPETVAPNILSLAGLLCIVYAYQLSSVYLSAYPISISIIATLLTFSYMNLDAIDGKQARKIGNSSSLGELFDHSCDNIGVVFMILTFCNCVGIVNVSHQWYIVQICQLIFLYEHIKAYQTRIVKFGRFTGPGECLLIYMGIILLNAFDQLSWVPSILNLLPLSINDTLMYTHNIVFVFVIFKILLMDGHYTTKYSLIICLGMRIVPTLLLMINTYDEMTVMCNGIVMAILTGEIIICKMANKEFHSLVIIFMGLSLYGNMMCVVCCTIYYVLIIFEIANYLHVPVFNVHRNVYCNGVYDMCHLGHMKLFEHSSIYGTKLIVGVHSDADVASYKRTPIMNHDERVSIVKSCKFVNQVIQNAPLVIDEKFIKDHNIHVVCCSPEYDSVDDHYYAVPRKMNILKVLPRTDGVSSSILIKRMQNY